MLCAVAKERMIGHLELEGIFKGCTFFFASKAILTDIFTFLEFIPMLVEFELSMNHGQVTFTEQVLE